MLIPKARLTPPWLPNVPEPEPGFSYMVIKLPKETVERIGRLDAGGHWEDELQRRLEETIEHFYRTRPVELLRTPGR